MIRSPGSYGLAAHRLVLAQVIAAAGTTAPDEWLRVSVERRSGKIGELEFPV